MNRFCSLGAAILAVWLASCGSSPPVRYYTLEAPVVSGSTDGADSIIIGMGPLRLPEYLKRSRMVSRGAGSELIVNEQARWAEPLDKAMHRVLAASVDKRLSDVVMVAFPYLETVAVNYVVLGQVERFDSDENGRVVLAVQWGVMDPNRESLIPPRRSNYESGTGNPNDPDQIARAMNSLLEQFSQDIAEQLSDALARAAVDAESGAG